MTYEEEVAPPWKVRPCSWELAPVLTGIIEYAHPMMMADSSVTSLCTSCLRAGDLEVRIPQRTRVCGRLSPLKTPKTVNYFLSGHAFKAPDLSVCTMSVAQQGKQVVWR